MGSRGSYGFDVAGSGRLVNSVENLNKLRDLFRNSTIINVHWGPGDEGDFDHGSWHILCHLAGGSGVLNTTFGRAWCGITHLPTNDSYQATITFRSNGISKTVPLNSKEGTEMVDAAECLGFIEGTSLGHIAARGVIDDGKAFNGWKRQSFDQDPSSEKDGGTVWEHWVTTRDVRATSMIGTSVLAAYLALVSCLGGRFVTAVARGRRQHQHPEQLVALVNSGFVTTEEATWDLFPDPIPIDAQDLLYEARPEDAVAAAELLPFTSQQQHYFMFERRIQQWSKADDVKKDLGS